MYLFVVRQVTGVNLWLFCHIVLRLTPICNNIWKPCPRNAKYTSHRIQNDLIHLCGNQIRNQIIASIKSAGIFTVLADETAEISCTEQVAICMRYTVRVDKMYTAQEDCVAFLTTRDTTAVW